MKVYIGLCVLACLAMYSCKQKTNSTVKNDSGIDVSDDVQAIVEGTYSQFSSFKMPEVPKCGEGRGRNLVLKLIMDAEEALDRHRDRCRKGLGEGYLCPQSNVMVAKWGIDVGGSGDITWQHEDSFNVDKLEEGEIRRSFNQNFERVGTIDTDNNVSSSTDSTTSSSSFSGDGVDESSSEVTSANQSYSGGTSNIVTTDGNDNSDSNVSPNSKKVSDSDTTSVAGSLVVSLGVEYKRTSVKTEIAPDSSNHMKFVQTLLLETCYE